MSLTQSGGLENGVVSGTEGVKGETARQRRSRLRRSLLSTNRQYPEEENGERPNQEGMTVDGANAQNSMTVGGANLEDSMTVDRANLEDSTAVVASLLHRMDLVEEPVRPACVPPSPTPTSEVLCVTVHCTGVLKASIHISRPVVRVSIVDREEGGYVKKSRVDRCVTSFYERGNPSVDYIQPIMTQPFNCRRHRLVIVL